MTRALLELRENNNKQIITTTEPENQRTTEPGSPQALRTGGGGDGGAGPGEGARGWGGFKGPRG